jgi:hypothetical protein
MTLKGYLSKPYVLMDVHELLGVTDIKHWANVKIRVTGTIRGPSALISVSEQGGSHNIAVQNGKAIQLQPWTVPEGSRMLRIADFKTIGIHRNSHVATPWTAVLTPARSGDTTSRHR